MKKIILFIIIFAAISTAQNKNISNNFLPDFYFDLAAYKSKDSSKTKLDVLIKVPYSNIQFVKIGKKYKAQYTITVVLYDDDDEIKLERLWNENISTSNFKQTTSHNSFSISYKSFKVEPGEYKFVCKLEDKESEKYLEYSEDIKIREFADSFDLSDIILISKFFETKEGRKLLPSVSNLYTSKDSTISFYLEIYSEKEQDVNLHFAIVDKDENYLFKGSKLYHLVKGKNEIDDQLNGVNFVLGKYKFLVSVFDEKNDSYKAVTKNITTVIFGFPSSIQNLDMAIAEMQYIAKSGEIDDMEETKEYQERLKKFLAFWKRLDPSPNTIENETLNEYYRRIDYANAHFKGSFKGWRSDMGMVYVTLGPPDQVIKRPYEMDSKPYEIWDYYSLNRRFIFVDVTNFGDYRLQNPAYGDWFRYRP
ncbi:MAG: hypothetical protein CR986_07715 [Ignavibacteriae bacterium]|nr:MAG: hypothetical protein CR986_07715 [Ignavibacteriota bacterium]